MRMSREIKFRAWDKDKGVMVYAKPVWQGHTGCVMAGWENYHADELGEYQQYTGLKDMNGREIYENDTVRILYTGWQSHHLASSDQKKMSIDEYKIDISSTGRVVWNYDGWSLSFGPGRGWNEDCGTLIPGPHGEMQVIGNIYENPELLDAQQGRNGGE